MVALRASSSRIFVYTQSKNTQIPNLKIGQRVMHPEIYEKRKKGLEPKPRKSSNKYGVRREVIQYLVRIIDVYKVVFFLFPAI